MKFLFSILTFFTTSLDAQPVWKLDANKERLYKEIAAEISIQELGYFIDEDPSGWKKADSFFIDMPLNIALEYYTDSAYPIRYYSFMKILGQDDSLAFKKLEQYISDSTKIAFQLEDIGGEIPFNEILVRSYVTFIDSKYYWCDTKTVLYRKYFRKDPFIFTKITYAKWPGVLTSFIEFVKPWNIKHNLDINDLKYYHGVEYFHGR